MTKEYKKYLRAELNPNTRMTLLSLGVNEGELSDFLRYHFIKEGCSYITPTSSTGFLPLNIIIGTSLDQDIGKIERATLKYHPNDEFFYIGNGDGIGFHIVHWDKTHPNGGGRSAVKLIKNEYGEELYRNDEIPFKLGEKQDD